MFRVLTFGLFAAAVASTAGLAPTPSAVAKDNVIFLKQGWSDEDRLRYYFTSQGTAVMPYDLFVNLEEAASSDLIRSDRIVESLGMIPQAPDPKYNPDGLPVGITRAVVPDGRWKGEWAGVNCAACHTDELHYKGARIRIDGGAGTHLDFLRLVAGLDDALAASVASPDKFDRLAARMKRTDAGAKAELREATGNLGQAMFTATAA